jgi:hypothetical protein
LRKASIAESVSALTWCSMPSASIRAVSAGVGKKDGAIRLLSDQLVVLEALEGLDHGRGGDAKPLGDVGAASFAALFDELGDELDIVFGDLALMVRAHPLEGLGLGKGALWRC